KNSNKRILMGIIVVIIILVMATFLYFNFSKNSNSSNNLYSTTIPILESGTQTNPYMPDTNNTLIWQGPGYYYVPINVPASGLAKGVDELSAPSQITGYNQWVSQLGVSSKTVENTTS